MKKCKVDGCEKPHQAKGFCGQHYMGWKRWGDPLGMKYVRNPIERFHESYMPVTESGCWLWLNFCYSSHNALDGYGQLRVNGVLTSSHRFSWEIHNGPIPDGMIICHKCDTPSCVNPDHLFLGTLSDNMQDAMQKGRFLGVNHYKNNK